MQTGRKDETGRPAAPRLDELIRKVHSFTIEPLLEIRNRPDTLSQRPVSIEEVLRIPWRPNHERHVIGHGRSQLNGFAEFQYGDPVVKMRGKQSGVRGVGGPGSE